MQPGEHSRDRTYSHPLAAEPDIPDGSLGAATGNLHIVSHTERLARLAAETW